ncbi:hypothetical protein KKJ21_24720, partial [Xenorhabdus bovienii]|uniref:hypothetical protein n=1 Tax=Xenorhabdus bovienii TaxID=40576 RepID=UPI0023AFF11A
NLNKIKRLTQIILRFINYFHLNETRTKLFLENFNMQITLSNESQAGLVKNKYRYCLTAMNVQ